MAHELTKGSIARVVGRLIDVTAQAMNASLSAGEPAASPEPTSPLVVGIEGSVKAPGKSGKYLNGRHDAVSFRRADHRDVAAFHAAVADAVGQTIDALGMPGKARSEITIHRNTLRRRDKYLPVAVTRAVVIDAGADQVHALSLADAIPAQLARLHQEIWAITVQAMEAYRGPLSAQIDRSDGSWSIVVKPQTPAEGADWYFQSASSASGWEGKLHCRARPIFGDAKSDPDPDQDDDLYGFGDTSEAADSRLAPYRHTELQIAEIRIGIDEHIDTFKLINTLDRGMQACWSAIHAEATSRVVDRFLEETGLRGFQFQPRLITESSSRPGDSVLFVPPTRSQRDTPIVVRLDKGGYGFDDRSLHGNRGLDFRSYLKKSLNSSQGAASALKSWRFGFDIESMGEASKALIHSVISPDASSLAMSFFGHTGLSLVDSINRKLKAFENIGRDGLSALSIDGETLLAGAKTSLLREEDPGETYSIMEALAGATAKNLSKQSEELLRAESPRLLGKCLARAGALARRRANYLGEDGQAHAVLAGESLAAFINACAAQEPPFLPGHALLEAEASIRCFTGLSVDEATPPVDVCISTSVEMAKVLHRFQTDASFKRRSLARGVRELVQIMFDHFLVHTGRSSAEIESHLLRMAQRHQQSVEAPLMMQAGVDQLQAMLASSGLPNCMRVVAASKPGHQSAGKCEHSARKQAKAILLHARGEGNAYEANPQDPPAQLTWMALRDERRDNDDECEAFKLVIAVDLPRTRLDTSLRPPALQVNAKNHYGQVLLQLSACDALDSSASPPLLTTVRLEVLEWTDPHEGASLVNSAGHPTDLSHTTLTRTICPKANAEEHQAVTAAILEQCPQWLQQGVRGPSSKPWPTGSNANMLSDGLMSTIKSAIKKDPDLATCLINGAGAFSRSLAGLVSSIPRRRVTALLRAALDTTSHNGVHLLFSKATNLWLPAKPGTAPRSLLAEVAANGTRRQVWAACQALASRFGEVPPEHAQPALDAALRRQDPHIVADLMRLGGWKVEQVKDGLQGWHGAFVPTWLKRQLAAAEFSASALSGASDIQREPFDPGKQRRVRL